MVADTKTDDILVKTLKQAMLRDDNCESLVPNVRMVGTTMRCLYVTLPTNIAEPLMLISHALGKSIKSAEGKKSFESATTEWKIPVSDIENAPEMAAEAPGPRFGESTMVAKAGQLR